MSSWDKHAQVRIYRVSEGGWRWSYEQQDPEITLHSTTEYPDRESAEDAAATAYPELFTEPEAEPHPRVSAAIETFSALAAAVLVWRSLRNRSR